MRQQLISWLIEDIAPEIRRTKDAEGEIIKFAREHNLATAQVQALGQLFNTAKTLSFFDKSASHRGEPFPILDVDKMVDKFTSVEKSASAMPQPKFEYDDQDNGGGISLPACFAGLTHNVMREEEVAPAQIWENSAKRASMERSECGITRDLAQQAYFNTQEDMRKLASEIVTGLRRDPTYPFSELEADAWAIHGEEIRPIMTKLAKFCQDDGWPVQRATAPSSDKLVMDYQGLIPKVAAIQDRTYLIKAAIEILQPSSEAAGSGPMHTAAKIVDKNDKGDVVLKSAAVAEPTAPLKKIDPAALEEARNQESPKDDRSAQTPGGAGRSGGKPPGQTEPPKGGKPFGGGKPSGGGSAGQMFDQLSGKLDSLVGKHLTTVGGAGLRSFIPGRNTDQEKVDNDMQDARHIATLQNLMTTDEILAEADPDRVVSIYNTIRNMAPELAGDANVMRVLLRSAVQHEGISPFDLNSILDTELNKQRVDKGVNQAANDRYAIKSPFGGSKPGKDE